MGYGAKASRADAHPLLLAVHLDGGPLKIGSPRAAGLAVGMAYRIPSLGTLPAYLTFECHFSSLLKMRKREFYQNTREMQAFSPRYIITGFIKIMFRINAAAASRTS